jgi:hypothetical protein
MNLPLTTKQITFLSDIPSSINVDKTSGWRCHHLNSINVYDIQSWLKLIGDDKIYLIIPFFSTSESLSKARLRLSEPFLVDNKSNSALIIKFIVEQWNSSGFELKHDIQISFSFKFKRVWLTYK